MSINENEEKCFTFTWKLENASYCLQKKYDRIESPVFQVVEIQQSTWKLRLYPRGYQNGDYISFYLARDMDSKGDGFIKVRYDLAFVSKDGIVLNSSDEYLCDFQKNGGKGSSAFQNREEAFVTKRSIFLPHDTLTARCRIWKSDGCMTQNYRYSARTRVGIEKRSFLWQLENFSNLESEKKCTYLLETAVNDAPLMFLDLFVTGGVNCNALVRFELYFQDKTFKYATLRLHVVDAAGTRVECHQDEFWLDEDAKCKQVSFSLAKNQFMAKKSLYLPGDVLSLSWDWTFSKGVVLEEIEEIQCGCTTFESKFSPLQNPNKEEMVPQSHNLKSLYDEGFLCDVKLTTSTRVFLAHKVILSASSPVFKAMFLSDMKEKNSDCVNIDDLSVDAVSGMLLYMYTARVDGLTWKAASQLYVAADKYAILSLKNICSSYMKDNLSVGSACELLLLSDFHSDSDLKAAVQDYILSHVKDIVNSDEWKLMMENNTKLAAETLCLQYK